MGRDKPSPFFRSRSVNRQSASEPSLKPTTRVSGRAGFGLQATAVATALEASAPCSIRSSQRRCALSRVTPRPTTALGRARTRQDPSPHTAASSPSNMQLSWPSEPGSGPAWVVRERSCGAHASFQQLPRPRSSTHCANRTATGAPKDGVPHVHSCSKLE